MVSYKEGIIKALDELKDRTGSSLPAIKKHMQASLPQDKKWANGTFLSLLKSLVSSGDLVQLKGSYKLSADFKKKRADALKPKVPKKKVATKATIATAPKKKAATAKKSTGGMAAPKKKGEAAPKTKAAPKKKAAAAAPKKTKAAPKKKENAAAEKKGAPKKKALVASKKAAPKKKVAVPEKTQTAT